MRESSLLRARDEMAAGDQEDKYYKTTFCRLRRMLFSTSPFPPDSPCPPRFRRAAKTYRKMTTVRDSFNEGSIQRQSLPRHIVFLRVLLKNFTNESYDFSSALQTGRRSFAYFHKRPFACPSLSLYYYTLLHFLQRSKRRYYIAAATVTR